MRVAFIGLGRMGSAMARNLIHAGHEVGVFNRSQEKAKALAAEGARVATSPRDACRGAEAVETMLADDSAVEQVVFGENGIAPALESNAVHVSHSTISTSFARRLQREHQKRGQSFLSAPVFGRPDSAEAKKLVVVTAGDRTLIDRYRGILDAIGRRTFVVGPEPWHANAVKINGNFMILSMVETFGEAFASARKSGIDPRLFLDVINEVWGSPVYQNYGATIVDQKFQPAAFALKLGLKDIRLALEAAQEQDVPMPFASVIRDQFLAALAHGDGELDVSALTTVAARNAGLGRINKG